MINAIYTIYQPGIYAEQLANKVLYAYFAGDEPSFSINPFEMMKKMGVIYQFMEFKRLEGIYLVPKDENDIAVIGINFNRPITRKRFTAAHEMCHHIKDRETIWCPISKKNYIEKYADKFASELLMPKEYLFQIARQYIENEFVSFENVIYIVEYFGVSFESCVMSLAYKLNLIDGDINSKELTKRCKKFKPDIKKEELGIKKVNIELVKQTINSHTYF